VPLSIWLGMEQCLEEIVACRPTSVLDAGIGFGLWGHLLRQYLDVWNGRIQPQQWRVRIDGIEIDESRVLEHARYLYDRVHVGDIRELVPPLAMANRYDVILFGDVLEHLPKQDATLLLRKAVALANDRVVVRIPLGEGWRREGREEPDHHRSQWSLDDFAGFAGISRQYVYCNCPYAVIVIDALQSRVRILERAEARLADIEALLLVLVEERARVQVSSR